MAGETAKNWTTAKLGDVADVLWGDTSTTKASYITSGFPAYSASGHDGFLPYADFDKTGVVVSAIGAECGKTWLAKGKWSCIKNTIRFWSKVPDVDTEFLYWLTNNPKVWPKRGSAQPFISQGDARAMNIAYPPLPEQRAIASVLGALDDKIEVNRRMNATLEAMARALFQSWFVDFDPVRAKSEGRQPEGMDAETAALFPAEFEESELGMIPKGWSAGKLNDIATNSRRVVQPSGIAPNTPYIALEHMPRRCIALGEWAESTDVASGKSAFRKGEILFGKLRPYFHKVGVAPLSGVCSTDILVIAPKSRDWFGFLLGHASSDELIKFADLASTGTKMPRTNWNDISSFKVAMPSKSLAIAFTKQIEPMVEYIIANLYQSRTLAALRDTLLPKLLSGELSCGGAP
jgi:type I restriction enzyme S subunit